MFIAFSWCFYSKTVVFLTQDYCEYNVSSLVLLRTGILGMRERRYEFKIEETVMTSQTWIGLKVYQYKLTRILPEINKLLNFSSSRGSLPESVKMHRTEWEDSTTYQNIWDTGKIVVRRKFMALNACIRKEKRYKINNLSFFEKTKKSKIKLHEAEERK